jgi:YHS domain-containing protein
MGGKAEYSLALEDYTLHFCSTTCWDHFNADPAAGLAGLIASVPPASKK